MNLATALLLGASLQDLPPIEDPSVTAPPPPAKITLTTGEVLEAVVIEETPGSYRLQHPVLGEIVLERTDVTTVETPSLEPEAPKSPWSGSLSFAIAGYENVNSNLELRVGGQIKRTTDVDQLVIEARYFFGVQNGETQNNNFLATIDYRRDLEDKRWYVFGTGQFQYDEFQSWEKRVSAWGGLGYWFVRDEVLEVNGRLGFGVSYEFGPDRVLPEALAGIEAVWRPLKSHTITAYFTIYPDVGDIQEFRIMTGAKWNMAIEGVDGLSFEAGVSDEYQSQITSGTRNDFRYYAGLKYDF